MAADKLRRINRCSLLLRNKCVILWSPQIFHTQRLIWLLFFFFRRHSNTLTTMTMTNSAGWDLTFSKKVFQMLRQNSFSCFNLYFGCWLIICAFFPLIVNKKSPLWEPKGSGMFSNSLFCPTNSPKPQVIKFKQRYQQECLTFFLSNPPNQLLRLLMNNWLSISSGICVYRCACSLVCKLFYQQMRVQQCNNKACSQPTFMGFKYTLSLVGPFPR